MPFTAEDMTTTFLYRDEDLNEASAQVRFPVATTFADAETYAITNLLPLFDPLTIGTPYAVNIIQRRNRNLAPNDGSGEGEKKATFLIINDARGQPTTKVSIPGCDGTILKSDEKNIDQSQAAVDEFLNAIIAGVQADGTTPIIAGITGCVSRRGSAFVSSSSAANRAKAAYKYHIRSGRGARRRAG